MVDLECHYLIAGLMSWGPNLRMECLFLERLQLPRVPSVGKHNSTRADKGRKCWTLLAMKKQGAYRSRGDGWKEPATYVTPDLNYDQGGKGAGESRAKTIDGILVFWFFSIPFIIFALLVLLPPSSNADPGSHIRLFSPLPTMVRTLISHREKGLVILSRKKKLWKCGRLSRVYDANRTNCCCCCCCCSHLMICSASVHDLGDLDNEIQSARSRSSYMYNICEIYITK